MMPIGTFPTIVAVGAATLVWLASPALAQETSCGADVQIADVNGTKLHYIACGQGEPVVLVHGTLGGLHTWSAQIDEFAAEFRVITYSRRYHPPNDSPRPDDAYALEQHAADLAALIESLGASPAHIVASSYGAYVALAVALAHPELVRSLVLGEPPVLPLLSSTAVGKAVAESFDARVLRPARAAFEGGDLEEGVRRFVDGVSGQPGRFDQLPGPVRADLMNRAAELESEMLTEFGSYMPVLACRSLGLLRTPVLLVSGEQSMALFTLITSELERCLDGESHVMVPDAGHVMHGNAPFYNAAVLAFLRGR